MGEGKKQNEGGGGREQIIMGGKMVPGKIMITFIGLLLTAHCFCITYTSLQVKQCLGLDLNQVEFFTPYFSSLAMQVLQIRFSSHSSTCVTPFSALGSDVIQLCILKAVV